MPSHLPAIRPPSRELLIGVLKGEGVGPEVIETALAVLEAIRNRFGLRINLEFCGPIGLDAKRSHATELPEPVIDFCTDVFKRDGAILSGPGGGRYVYDLRRRLDLFYKINPLADFPELKGVSRLKPGSGPPTDILLVRENLSGLYQGRSLVTQQDGLQTVAHTFLCEEGSVVRILKVAARLAGLRRGKMTVVVKQGGLPEISQVWRRCAEQVAVSHQLHCEWIDIDFGAYQLLQSPESFDVIVAPNCFGDILADLGGLFYGSRGLTYGASYSDNGAAVYQTNHGSAHDLAGKDRANPVGQILSLAMLLRESFGRDDEAGAIVMATRSVWAQGVRTADLMEPGCSLVGTAEMGDRIAREISSKAQREVLAETASPAH
jgi:3-isopropylmalate dehydrogenase